MSCTARANRNCLRRRKLFGKAHSKKTFKLLKVNHPRSFSSKILIKIIILLGNSKKKNKTSKTKLKPKMSYLRMKPSKGVGQ